MKPHSCIGCGTHQPVLRRKFLLGAAGALSSRLLRAHPDAEAITPRQAVSLRRTAKVCVFLTLNGGPSHLDTFDPKDGPWNPADADIRQYGGGIVLSRQFFPGLSKITNDLCVLRSVSSWEGAHERGIYYLQTAHPFNPAFASEIPHVGAVIAKERGMTGRFPPFLGLNAMGIRGSTFLGGAYRPMELWPTTNGLATLTHDFYGAESQKVFDEKFALLQALDADLRRNPYNQAMADYASFYDPARGMMYDNAIGSIFRVSSADQQRYGNTGLGTSLCNARNAIRARNGVTFISVVDSNARWDAHIGMFDRSTPGNHYDSCRQLDTALSEFIADLKASGDFASTLIVVMGEFGRTPGPLNVSGGRDHYQAVQSVLLIGGGVRGGRAIGVTDATGAQIVDFGWRESRPIFMEDIAATIYSALGVDYTKSILDTPSRRRFEYIPEADQGGYHEIEEVFA